MITTILADCDGVLIASKDLHFHAFNEALRFIKQSPLTAEEHYSRFDGLSTKQKIEILCKERNLNKKDCDKLDELKKDYTVSLVKDCIKYDQKVYDLFSALKREGYRLGIATNSIQPTTEKIIDILGIRSFLSCSFSNNCVYYPKPNPEIYLRAMTSLGAKPEETLIIEDSPNGVSAAIQSGAHVLTVKNPADLDINRINEFILNLKNKPKVNWVDKKLNIVIPMAGAGKRFKEAGFIEPKPLIPLPNFNNKPMIQVVVESLGIDAHYIYMVRVEDYTKYNLENVLNLITPGCEIYELHKLTDGAARTVLTASNSIDNDNELLVVNSDQFIEWNSAEFIYKMRQLNADGGIVTFRATDPKWSFAKVDKNGKVLEVAEKRPISDRATTGHYYFKKGSDFVKYANIMIEKNIRTNNEFYVCPTYSQLIEDNKLVYEYRIDKMYGLGDPESFNNFVKSYKK